MHDCKDKKLGASTRSVRQEAWRVDAFRACRVFQCMIVTRSVKTRSLARRRVQSLSSVRVHDCKDKKLGALGARAAGSSD